MRIITGIIFLLLLRPAFGQDTPPPVDFGVLKGLPLDEALNYLTNTYDYRFSYNPQAIRDIIVGDASEIVGTPGEFLTAALQNTGMTFTEISGTYVIHPKTDIPLPDTALRVNFALSGIVRDKTTREALPFATITLQGTKISATSNTDGKFTLLNVPADSLYIHIRYLGYVPLSEKLSDTPREGVVTFEMLPRRRDLPSVEISAQMEELIEIQPEPGHITFNSGQISKLPNLGESDVFSALRRLPGIRGGLDASTGLKIRGGYSDENLFLFDGITVYHVDHFYGYLSAFNSGIIKNIQIDKGPYSARYGGRTSGVVNITGIDGNKLKPALRAEVNSLSANIVAELPLVGEKASLVVAYRRAITNFIRTPAYRNMFNNIFNASIPVLGNQTVDVFESDNIPDFTYYDFNAKVNFKPSDKDAISLSYYQGRDKTRIRFEGSFEDLKRNSLDNSGWGTNGIAVKWSRKWNKRLFTYANYASSDYTSNLEAEDSFYLAPDDELLSKIFFQQNNTVEDKTLRLDNSFEIDQKTHLEFGYWNSRYQVGIRAQNQNTALIDSFMEATLQAGYAELYRKIGPWDFTLGMRPSYYSGMDQWYWEPRISVKNQIFKNLLLKGSYGIFHQIIRRLNERSLYLSIPETWTISGKSTIPVLRSDQYMIGFLFNPDDWQIDLEAFHKFERGTVDYLLPEFGFNTGDLNQYAIDGNRRIYGIDFIAKRAFSRQYILLGYSLLLSQTRYPEVNRGEYFRSPGTSAHEFNLVYNFECRRWDFSAAFVLASGQPFTPVLGTYVITLPDGEEQQYVSVGTINSKNLEWYNRLDVGVNYTVPMKKGVLSAGISIYNVYNHLGTRYIDYFEIPDAGSGHFDLGRRDIRSLGFTPSAFIRFKI